MHRNVPALLITGRYAPVCDVSSSSSVDTASEVGGGWGGGGKGLFLFDDIMIWLDYPAHPQGMQPMPLSIF